MLSKKFLVGAGVVSVIVLTSGCGGVNTIKKQLTPVPSLELMHFEPKGEVGSPHDMEWIVDNFTGNGGYYPAVVL